MQLTDFESKYKAMLARKKRDTKGLMDEIGTLIQTTTSACGRSETETACLASALASVQLELSHRESELAAGREPIQTKKNSKEFDDNIVLLTMELMTLGVSENICIVGQVECLCSRHLANRELQQVVSKSSARRWGLQLPEMTIHHLGEKLAENAERGYSMSTDTTTIRQAERAANVYEVRLGDGSIKKFRGPVTQLASHTAEEQMQHNVLYVLSDTRRVMDAAALVLGSERVSIAYFNRVMGDHVNGSLWDLVEAEKYRQLDELVASKCLTAEIAAQMRIFVRTKCSKYKLAKISRDGCNAMGEIQDKTVAKFVNTAGHDMAGRTYKAIGPKLIEVVSWQFSCNISVQNPHGHAQAYLDWAEYHGLPAFCMPNVNKNRHFRHEREAGKVLGEIDHLIEYLTMTRDGRDDLVHPNKITKLGNADSRIWLALHPSHKIKHIEEARAQICAMNMEHSLFYGPALCMITTPCLDVITIGAEWRAGHEYLIATAPSKTDQELMQGGLEHRCFQQYHKKDKTILQSKTRFELEFSPPVIWKLIQKEKMPYCDPVFQSRVMEYFRYSIKKMAAGLKSIASEYFPGGDLYEPSDEIKAALTGYCADNDHCEGQLGDERRMIDHACGKIASRKISGFNMARHNGVFGDIRSSRTANTTAVRGKLYNERMKLEGTEKETRARMAARLQPIKEANRKLMMQKVDNRRKAKLAKLKQFQAASEVNSVFNDKSLKVGARAKSNALYS